MAKRVFLVVLDSFGVGEEPDAASFGDYGVNTLRSIAQSSSFNCPNLRALGLFNLDGIDFLPSFPKPLGAFVPSVPIQNFQSLAKHTLLSV